MRVPIYGQTGNVANVSRGAATVNPGAFSAPFEAIGARIGEYNRMMNASLSGIRQQDSRIAGLYASGTFFNTHPDTTAMVARAVSATVPNIADAVSRVAINNKRQKDAIDLINRHAGATQEAVDWYQENAKTFRGMNSFGFTDAAKQKVNEINKKYGEGLTGLPAARFRLYGLSNYDTIVKSAASQEAREQQGLVTTQTQQAISDAVSLGAQAATPEDFDKIILNLSTQLDTLNPDTDNSVMKTRSVQTAISGAVHVLASQGNLDLAGKLIDRYKDDGLVKPSTIVSFNNAKQTAAREAEAIIRRQDSEAKKRQYDNQQQFNYELFSSYRKDPRGFINNFTPEMVDALVRQKRLSPGQGASLIRTITDPNALSDPGTLNDAHDMIANGTMTTDWIREHAKMLNWNDLNTIENLQKQQATQSVEGVSIKSYVHDMFSQQVRMLRGQPSLLAHYHGQEIQAQKYANQLLLNHVPLNVIQAAVSLKYSPSLATHARAVHNDYFTTYPQDEATLQQHWQNLYSGVNDWESDQWQRNFSALTKAHRYIQRRLELQRIVDAWNKTQQPVTINTVTNTESPSVTE